MANQPLMTRSNRNRDLTKYIGGFFFSIIIILVLMSNSYGEISNVSKKSRIWDQSNNWPTCLGIVVGIDIGSEEHITQDQDIPSSFWYYYAIVSYVYAVDGKEYFSNNLDFRASKSSSQSHAREIANKYKIDQDVVVYYDPNNPNEAVLIPGCEGCVIWPSIIDIACMGIGIVFGICLLFWTGSNLFNRLSIWINKKVES